MYGGVHSQFMTRCLDRFSIFIGNLHESILDADLSDKFGLYGTITNIHVVRKPTHQQSKRVFAFVRYEEEGAALKAIDNEVTHLDVYYFTANIRSRMERLGMKR